MKWSWKSAFVISLANAVILGAIVGGAILYAGFQHNSQGEFFDPVTGAVKIRFAALILLGWGVPVACLVLAVELTVHLVARLLRR